MLKETKTTEINDYIVLNGGTTDHNFQNGINYTNANSFDHSKEIIDQELTDQVNKAPDELRDINAEVTCVPNYSDTNSITSINNAIPLDKNINGFYGPPPSFMPFMQPSPCPTMFSLLFPHHPSLMHPLLPPAQFMFPAYNPALHSALMPMLEKNEMLNYNRDVLVNDIKKIANITDVIKDENQSRNDITFPFASTPNNLGIAQQNNKLVFDLNNDLYEKATNEYAKYLSSFPPHYPSMQSLQPLPLNAFLPSYNPLMIPPSPMPVLGPFYSLPHPFLAQNLGNAPPCGSMLRDQGMLINKETEEEDARCRQEVASLFKNEKINHKLLPRFVSSEHSKDSTTIDTSTPKAFVDLNNNILPEQIPYQGNENFYKYRDISKLKHRTSKDLTSIVHDSSKHGDENGSDADGYHPTTNGETGEQSTGDDVVAVVRSAATKDPATTDEEPLHKRMRVISLSKEATDPPADHVTPNGPPRVVRTGDDSIFRKGTRIYLQNGDAKLVEHLTTRDFANSCGANPDYDIVKGEVLSIQRRHSRPRPHVAPSDGIVAESTEYDVTTAEIRLAIKDGLNATSPVAPGGVADDDSGPPLPSTRVTNMEVTLSHLFFVPHANGQGGGTVSGGWASVSPERSLRDLGLRCRQLRPGDDCLVVLTKNKDLLLTDRAGSTKNGPVRNGLQKHRGPACNLERLQNGGGGGVAHHGHPWSALVPSNLLNPKSQISSS